MDDLYREWDEHINGCKFPWEIFKRDKPMFKKKSLLIEKSPRQIKKVREDVLKKRHVCRIKREVVIVMHAYGKGLLRLNCDTGPLLPETLRVLRYWGIKFTYLNAPLKVKPMIVFD